MGGILIELRQESLADGSTITGPMIEYRTRHIMVVSDAGWSSLVAREAHNLEVVGSNPAPATDF